MESLCLNHFGLKEKPFKAGYDPDFLWLSASRKAALDALARGVLEESGLSIVTGDAGTGKTTVANALLGELSGCAVATRVTYPDVEGLDFLKLIAKACGLGGGPRSREAFVEQFTSFLHSSYLSGRRVVLIIDEAQRLPPECMDVLLRLSGIRENGSQLLKLVLVGQPSLEEMLAQAQGGEPERQIARSHKVEKLTQGEAAQYIAHRLRAAGCEKELFSPRAVQEVFAVSRGIPALINMVSDLCLSRTFTKGESTVRPETVKECVKLLRLPDEKAEPVTEPAPMARETDLAVQPAPGKPMTDRIRERIAGMPTWARTAFASAIAFLVVSIGMTLAILPGTPPDTRHEEGKKDAEPAAGDRIRRTTSPPGQASSDAPAQLNAPGVAQQGGSTPVTRTRKGSRKSTEQARQSTGERLQDRDAPTDGGGQGTSADSGGSARREPARPGAQDVESGRVIDWLIKKRAEQK